MTVSQSELHTQVGSTGIDSVQQVGLDRRFLGVRNLRNKQGEDEYPHYSRDGCTDHRFLLSYDTDVNFLFVCHILFDFRSFVFPVS